MIRAQGYGLQLIAHETVLGPVDIEVETEVEEMIVVDCYRVLAHESSISGVDFCTFVVGGSARYAFDLLDSACADSHTDRPILLKRPIERVVVVADRTD